jgi:ATP-dependent exoDNAse (exonuclease V) alpha subunit
MSWATRTWAWQFQAAKYRTTLRATVRGMKHYLGSGLVKGIGPVNAGRIVDAFGETTFSVIDETPDRSVRRTSPRTQLNEAAASLATSERICCAARLLPARLARATKRAEAQTLRSGPGLLCG